jgi:hypothetical protein
MSKPEGLSNGTQSRTDLIWPDDPLRVLGRGGGNHAESEIEYLFFNEMLYRNIL